MDPVAVILTALSAGAAAGLSDAVSGAITDAYGALKSMLLDRLRSRPDGDVVLERYEQAPDTWEAPLTAELRDAGIGDDDEIVEKAKQLIELLRANNPSTTGRYNVDLSQAQGVQIGDHGEQHNTFTERPRPS